MHVVEMLLVVADADAEIRGKARRAERRQVEIIQRVGEYARGVGVAVAGCATDLVHAAAQVAAADFGPEPVAEAPADAARNADVDVVADMPDGVAELVHVREGRALDCLVLENIRADAKADVGAGNRLRDRGCGQGQQTSC